MKVRISDSVSGRTCRGFTLIELLVVVAIIALLISILLPSLGKAKEMANRAYCSANLRGIGISFQTYAFENGQFPGCLPVMQQPGSYFNGFSNNAVVGSTDAVALAITAQQGIALTPLWIMALRNQTPPKMFWCKSDRFVVGSASTTSSAGVFVNFQDQYQISYSLAYPWAMYWHGGTMESYVPLACDMAPFSDNYYKKTDMSTAQTTTMFNSTNHMDQGQNVMYGDTHAEFCRSPYVGPNGDNIFTLGGGNGAPIGFNSISNTAGGVPTLTDSVMVPVRRASDGQMGN
jgi:prepilin-type N-terminal cleavage/methylation domain-containing protein